MILPIISLMRKPAICGFKKAFSRLEFEMDTPMSEAEAFDFLQNRRAAFTAAATPFLLGVDVPARPPRRLFRSEPTSTPSRALPPPTDCWT